MLIRAYKTYSIIMVFIMAFLWSTNPLRAEIQEVKIKVKGLSCPFCVYGIESHIKKVNGVDKVTTNLKKSEVVLQYKSTASFDLKSIQKAVTEGGFTLGSATVTVLGVVTRKDDYFQFNVLGTDSSFLLFGDEHQELSEDILSRLDKASKTRQTLQITGRVHSHKEALPGLSVEELKETVK